MFPYILVFNLKNHIFRKEINFLLALNTDDFIIWIFREENLKIIANVPTAVLSENGNTSLPGPVCTAPLTSLLKIHPLKTKKT